MTSRVEYLQLWNHALGAWYFPERTHAPPVRLAVDDAALRAVGSRLVAHLAFDGQDPVRDFELTIREFMLSTLDFGRWRKKTPEFRKFDPHAAATRGEVPPFLALLAADALAASRLHDRVDGRDRLHPGSHYARLREILGHPPKPAQPEGYEDNVPLLWRDLNTWLDAAGGRYGTPTAAPGSHAQINVGWAQSQALLRGPERAELYDFFSDIGVAPRSQRSEGAPGLEAMPALLLNRLRVWIDASPSERRERLGRLRRVLDRDDDSSRLGELLSSLAREWDGETATREGEARLRARLAFDDAEDGWRARLEVITPAHLDGARLVGDIGGRPVDAPAAPGRSVLIEDITPDELDAMDVSVREQRGAATREIARLSAPRLPQPLTLDIDRLESAEAGQHAGYEVDRADRGHPANTPHGWVLRPRAPVEPERPPVRPEVYGARLQNHGTRSLWRAGTPLLVRADPAAYQRVRIEDAGSDADPHVLLDDALPREGWVRLEELPKGEWVVRLITAEGEAFVTSTMVALDDPEPPEGPAPEGDRERRDPAQWQRLHTQGNAPLGKSRVVVCGAPDQQGTRQQVEVPAPGIYRAGRNLLADHAVAVDRAALARLAGVDQPARLETRTTRQDTGAPSLGDEGEAYEPVHGVPAAQLLVDTLAWRGRMSSQQLAELRRAAGLTSVEWSKGLVTLRSLGVMRRRHDGDYEPVAPRLVLAGNGGAFARLVGCVSSALLARVEGLADDPSFRGDAYLLADRASPPRAPGPARAEWEACRVPTPLGPLILPVVLLGEHDGDADVRQVAGALGVPYDLDPLAGLSALTPVDQRLRPAPPGTHVRDTRKQLSVADGVIWVDRRGTASQAGAAELDGVAERRPFIHTRREVPDEPRQGTKREVAWAALREHGWQVHYVPRDHRLVVPAQADLPDDIGAAVFQCTGSPPHRVRGLYRPPESPHLRYEGVVVYSAVPPVLADIVSRHLLGCSLARTAGDPRPARGMSSR